MITLRPLPFDPENEFRLAGEEWTQFPHHWMATHNGRSIRCQENGSLYAHSGYGGVKLMTFVNSWSLAAVAVSVRQFAYAKRSATWSRKGNPLGLGR